MPIESQFAPAKVNLFLHVGPVQPNGRHPLDSLVVFADQGAADEVSAERDDGLSLSMVGEFADTLEQDSETNLVLRAAQQLKAAAGVSDGARLRLAKDLPIAAGIGGGSSDAAAALSLLSNLWNVPGPVAAGIAPGLGGDVPVALGRRAALMQGEGEQVRAVTLPGRLPAVLVNPGVPCPTGPVFRAFDAAGGGDGFQAYGAVPEFERVTDLVHWVSQQRNDLEAPALDLAPDIEMVLSVLRGIPQTRLARMSGSGATCFALFDTDAQAHAVADTLSAIHPAWWVRATSLGDAV